MRASEVMLEHAVVLRPEMGIMQALSNAAASSLDILPIVDNQGYYHGAVAKSVLVDSMVQPDRSVMDVCCADAIVCTPGFALERLDHDAQSAVPHQTIVVVGDDGRFEGIIPQVHWAVDEAKTQSGHPRNRLEARTVSMHLTWRCTDCGELTKRNADVSGCCPSCGADATALALHTED